jgi:alginate O-acetyltransferase complex protein AlgI
MFPQLIAGPIVRYTDIEHDMDNRHISVDDFAAGIRRFSVGLGKKAILANALAGTADSIWAVSDAGSASVAWIGLISYTLQIYFDFSGYSDMAIGLGMMLGFHFPENFRFPYISRSITEFWRRWHISLSTWFRDYVYIPLGGNRKHLYRNLIIVFFLTGLWHGAATKYVLWGLWHGLFMLIERATRGRALKFKESIPGKILNWAYAMLVVMLGWVLFRSDGTMAALSYGKVLFGLGGSHSLYAASWFLDRYTVAMLLLGIVFSTPLLSMLWKKVSSCWGETPRLVAENTGALVLLAYAVVRVMSSSYNPFIYFQF